MGIEDTSLSDVSEKPNSICESRPSWVGIDDEKWSIQNTLEGGWWLVVGGWWLVVGGWWLVGSGWWVVVSGWWSVSVGWWTVGRWWVDDGRQL